MIPLPTFSGDAYVTERVGDEIGFNAHDIAALYGVALDDLPSYLRALAPTPVATFQRVIADADALRVGYRRIHSTDSVIAVLQEQIAHVEFSPLIPVLLAAGGTGYRLDQDQANDLAERAATVTDLPADEVPVLARRLSRMTLWNRADVPAFDHEFRDRVVDMITFLIEFSEIL